MQSAMAYAVDEIARVDGPQAAAAGEHPPGAQYLDEATGRIDLDAVPHDDEATFRLIRTAHTLGCFQIESPGQRELVGKFGPETFLDLVIDISLFRPGPVKSDMITPFLRARQGWDDVDCLHPRLERALGPTGGVVVFHEQVLQIIDAMTGCGLAQADEVRRTLGSSEGQAEVEAWLRPVALAQGFDAATVDRVWEVLKAFASFGFCKAHAAAFALPTYQSAWLKAHHPAAFLAGVLTHDPGMYPKRLILDDARNLGIAVLPLDVNRSEASYRVEKVTWWDEPPPRVLEQVDDLDHGVPEASPPRDRPHPDLPDGRAYGIRLALADVKGITDAEVERIVAGRPYHSLADFWHRAGVSRPVVERLVVAGAFDTLYGLGSTVPVRRRGRVTRRDLLLQVAELDRWTRAATRGRTPRGGRAGAEAPAGPPVGDAVRAAAARQSQAPRAAVPARLQPVQLALDLGDAPDETVPAGLAEMTGAERVRAELEVLGLDASRHVLDFYEPLLAELGVTRARDLLQQRSRADLLVAGVKVATQTPPIRSGRRVVFLTLDDATGPVDATFFEDVQGPYAATVFHSWLLVVRGVLRRTGPRGVSLRATGAWELPVLWDAWTSGGMAEVRALLETAPGWQGAGSGAVAGAAASRSSRPVLARPPVAELGGGINPPYDRAAEEVASGLPVGDRAPEGSGRGRAGGMGGGPAYRRVLVEYSTGYRQSPYADVGPPGDRTRDTRRMTAAETSQDRADRREAAQREAAQREAAQREAAQREAAQREAAQREAARRESRGDPPRKLWHASPGSSGR
jgi:error-prone DNA polymerase